MSEPAPKLILVLGATGYTGRLMAAHLLEKGQPFAIAGRSLARLKELQTSLNLLQDTLILEADPTRPETLTELFRPEIGLVINCVGPYTSLGEPVVRAAIEAGVHYLDLSGEQAYIARIIEKYDDLARQNGCAIIPACGVEYTITNWAAAMAAKGLEPVENLWTATASKGIKASRGTKLSLFHALAKPGLSWKNGRVAAKLAASTVRRINFPAPFGREWTIWTPFGELVTIPRHIKVQNMASFFKVNPFLAVWLWFFSPLLPLFVRLVGPLLAGTAKGPEPGYSENSTWAVVAQAESEKGKRHVTIRGRNAYEVTAVITGWCAAQILRPDFKLSGTLGPAQAFDPQEALAYLADYGVSWNVS